MTTILIPARTLPKLLVPCADCEGQGMVYSPVWAEYNEEMKRWDRNPGSDPDKMPVEPHCSEEDQCIECDGRGEVATPDGDAILELMAWRDRA